MTGLLAHADLPPVGGWPDLALGNHRAVIQVAQGAHHVVAEIPWRRRDADWRQKAVVVTDKKGQRVANTVLLADSTQQVGRLVFEPTTGAGQYHVYYLPVEPGRGNFPQAKYLPTKPMATAAWLADVGLTAGRLPVGDKLPQAECLGFQARTEFDRFSDMERTASPVEVRALLARHPGREFLVFPEDRRHPIAMREYVPYCWAKDGPLDTFQGSALRDETFAFQLGVFAARRELRSVQLAFSDLSGANGAGIPASAMRCVNLGGVSWTGEPFRKRVDVPARRIQALWCLVQVPESAAPGTYTGTVEVVAEGVVPQRVRIELSVAAETIAKHGDDEAWRHGRLRWLDSTIALDDDDIPAPFEPLSSEGDSIHCLGREVRLGPSGLPAQASSFFGPSNTKLLPTARQILQSPIRFMGKTADGKALDWQGEGTSFTRDSKGVREWTARSRAGDLELVVHGRMEFDGWLGFRCEVTARKPVELAQFALDVPLVPAAAKYLMGMNKPGGFRPETHEWAWDQAKHQDSVWVGDVNAGLRLQLKGENYERPFVNIHYRHKPVALPPAWYNQGKGGCRIARQGDAVVVHAFSGPRTVQPGETLHFDFELLLTPFKLLDTEGQWTNRYYHVGSGWPHTGDAALSGPIQGRTNVVNIHQGNDLNPFINYPFLTERGLGQLVSRAHDKSLRVKLYYTVRELTNHVVELHALRSLGNEILAPGPGDGHQWLEEHLGGNYIQAWYQSRTYDASIITAGMSRWHNYYLEGLQRLCETVGIDGLYIDDVAYDRTIMKRVRRILEASPRGGQIDLHSWNHFNGRAGYASCANLYMENLPYIDRIWFGEGFHYDDVPLDYWLVEISGLPFGVMGEMLQHGGNLWLGQLFGMTNRLGWGGDPRPIWEFRDQFGFAGCQFTGFWDPASPVRSDAAQVPATVYRMPKHTVIALGNFSREARKATLTIDWQALGFDPTRAKLYAPPIRGFQPEMVFAPDTAIPVSPKRGWLLVLDETPRTVRKIDPEELLIGRRTLLEERFEGEKPGEWKTHPADGKAKRAEGELRLQSPAHHALFVERGDLPKTAAMFVCEIASGNDQGMTWGPGMVLQWPGQPSLKMNARSDGRYQVDVNGREHLLGYCQPNDVHTLAVELLAKEVVVWASSEGTYGHRQELLRLPRKGFPGVPTTVRLGKTARGGHPQNHGTPGPVGQCAIHTFRVLAAGGQ